MAPSAPSATDRHGEAGIYGVGAIARKCRGDSLRFERCRMRQIQSLLLQPSSSNHDTLADTVARKLVGIF